MSNEQKLREALQQALTALENVITQVKYDEECAAAIIAARQALAPPTADPLPDVKKMVVDHFPDATKMIETAAPVGERELPEPFGYVSDGAPDGLRFQHKPWPDVHALINSVMPVYSQAQMQAALSAGDAVDAQRYRWLKGRSQVCLNQVWIGGYTTRQRDGDFLSKEDALSAIETAIDAAMRKGQP